MAQGKIVIYRDTAGEWRFRFVAGNGQIVAASEGYKSKRACLKGIAAVVRVAMNHGLEINGKA